MVAHLVGHDRKLEVLSIIKRRDALGLLAHSDKEERWTKTRTELIGSIKIAFGGMTAEELFFGEAGTGPAGDLAHATSVAAHDGRIARHGGLARVATRRSSPDRSRRASSARCSATKRAATPSRRMLEQAKDEVRKLLDENRHLVVALRDALLERDELVGDEIMDVLRESAQRDALERSS